MPKNYILFKIKHLQITLQQSLTPLAGYLSGDLQYYKIISLIKLSENLIQHCLLAHIVLKFCDRKEIGQTKF